MATQNINIVIASTGGVTVVRNINQIGQAAVNAINPLRALQNQINAVMGALAVRQLMEWSDEWTAAANKVAVFSKTQQETNEILDRLYNVAQKVGQPLNGVVDLYHKLSIQAKALGASIEDNIRVTEIVSKALTIQGTSAQTAHGALLQLSQAFGTGKVKAQEYNSLLTGLPLILKVAAENIDAAGGSIAKLTQLQRAGKLSSKELYDAILKGGVDIDKIFGNMNRTFQQGFAVAVNGISRFLGELNNAYGISNKFYTLMRLLVDNLGTISKLLLVVAAGIVAAFAPAIVVAFGNALLVVAGALLRVSALLLANPFVLLAVAVAAVIAFGDSWDAGIDKMTTVKDVFRALLDSIVSGLRDVQEFIATVWDGFVTLVTSAFATASEAVKSSVGGWFQAFGDFYADVGDGFIGVLRGIAKTMDAIAGLITAVIILIGRLFGGLPEVVGTIFAQVYNQIATWMEKAINVVIDGINAVRAKTGAGLIEAVSFEKKNVNTKVFSEYGQSIADSIDAGFEAQGGFMVKQIDALEKKAQAFGANRRREAALAKNNVDLSARTDPDALATKAKKPKKDTELNKLQNDLRTLLNRIDPASGALLEMAKAQDVLNKAVERGLISEADRQRYLPLLSQHYKDIIDPLGKYNREIQEGISVLGLDARARSVEIELMKIKQDMMMKGQPLNDLQTKQMRDQLVLQQQLNEEAAIRDSLKGGSAAEATRTFGMQMEQIKKMMAGGGLTKGDATAKLQGEFPDLFEGTQEALDLRTQQFQTMYDRIDTMRQAEVISEQTAAQMKMKVANMEAENRLTMASQMFGGLASLASSSNRKVAAVGKAAAVAQATIDGYAAVQKALASAPPPYNYALAAGVAVQAGANIAKILNTQTAFAVGGDFQVGGSGGVDSQMVAFRASPGEQVSVSTPQQVRKGSASKDGGPSAANPTFKPTIVNVLDKSVMNEYMKSPDGQDAILNVIQSNPSIVRSAASGGRG
jgi:tape measure domain-containing protein